MTGRELIIYILQNNLEDEVVLDDIFMDEDEVAVKFKVGVSTVKSWYLLGMTKGLLVGDKLYFPKNMPDTRKGDRNIE